MTDSRTLQTGPKFDQSREQRRKPTARIRRPGRPSLREAEELHSRIVAAATNSFIVRGFSGTTLDVVAEDAGTSWRSVNARFPNRHALLLAVAESSSAAIYQNVLSRPELGPQDDELAHFRSICRRLLDNAVDKELSALTRVMLGEVAQCPALGGLVISYNNRAERAIEGVIVEAQQLGRFQRHSASAIAVSAMGVMHTNPLNRVMLLDPMFNDPHEVDLYFSKAWTIFTSIS